MIEANLTQLLVMSYRNLLKTNTSRYCPQVNVRVEDSLVYDVINLIDSGSYNIKNLGNIGKEVGYSYPYLSQIFSKKVGKSIMEYCQQRLFEKAVMMLEDNVSITNIAEKLGYKSIHSFSRAFSNYYGVSPSKYKVAMTGRHAAPVRPYPGRGTDQLTRRAGRNITVLFTMSCAVSDAGTGKDREPSP